MQMKVRRTLMMNMKHKIKTMLKRSAASWMIPFERRSLSELT